MKVPARFVLFVAANALVGCSWPESELPIEKSLPTRIEIPTEHFKLANGLDVVLHESHAAPIVSVRLNVRAGRANSPLDKPQVAHLVEHLMFAPRADGRRYMDIVTDVGAWNVGAETHDDFTTFHETAPRAALSAILWAEAQRIDEHQELVDDARFASEQALTRNEIERRFKNSPGGNVIPIIRETLVPPNHPYRLNANDEIGSIARITRNDENAFFTEFYSPNYMTLVIAGDFVASDARLLVEKYFGGFEPADVKRRPAPPPIVIDRNRTIHIDADVERQRVIIAWVLPPAGTNGLTEASLAGTYLAVLDKWVGLDANGFSVDRNRYASFGYYTMTLAPSTTPKRAIAHFENTLQSLVDDFVFPIGFGIVRAEALTSRLFAFEPLDARASLLSTSAIFENDPANAMREFQIARDVKRADVRDAAFQFLHEKKRLIAIVTPDASASRAGDLRDDLNSIEGQR